MSQETTLDPSPPAVPDASEPAGPAGPPDLAAIAQRMSRMQNKLLGDTSTLLHESAGLRQYLSESFEKLNATFAMLARSVVTSQVKVDEGHLETRRLISDQLDALTKSLRSELTERVVERFLLSTVATVVDDIDAVLSRASRKERALPSYDALTKLRTKLLAGLRVYGVEIMPVTKRETIFDETYHECTKVDTTHSVADGVIIDQDACGYMLNERVVRRAKVVVKGAR